MDRIVLYTLPTIQQSKSILTNNELHTWTCRCALRFSIFSDAYILKIHIFLVVPLLQETDNSYGLHSFVSRKRFQAELSNSFLYSNLYKILTSLVLIQTTHRAILAETNPLFTPCLHQIEFIFLFDHRMT